MYILDIEPPPDKNDENGGVTLMPACTVRKYNNEYCFKGCCSENETHAQKLLKSYFYSIF